mgnify:CR=1 FL=1
MVRGLDVFREHFAGHADQFVLIGGTAATLAMEEAGLEFRATKDLDIAMTAASAASVSRKAADASAFTGSAGTSPDASPRRTSRNVAAASRSIPCRSFSRARPNSSAASIARRR